MKYIARFLILFLIFGTAYASTLKLVDMTDYQYLQNFETLSGRNAQRVYTELEWE